MNYIKLLFATGLCIVPSIMLTSDISIRKSSPESQYIDGLYHLNNLAYTIQVFQASSAVCTKNLKIYLEERGGKKSTQIAKYLQDSHMKHAKKHEEFIDNLEMKFNEVENVSKTVNPSSRKIIELKMLGIQLHD